MKRKTRPAVPLFGVREKGSVLDLTLDLSRPMGIAHERCLDFRKADHSHERMVICAARGATRAEIRDASTGEVTLNHAGVVVVKPPRFRHSVRSLTHVYDDLALLPTEAFVRETGHHLGLGPAEVAGFLGACRSVGRSPWLAQLLEQYFLRRRFGAGDGAELAFFERELLRELFTLAAGSASSPDTGGLLPGPLRRVLERIEARLFEPLSLADLAAAGGMSRSTLLRHFADHLGTSPPAYIRARRLDEARALLKLPGRAVAEVAVLVGYRDVSAFGRAYRRQFGQSPKAKP